MLEPRARVLLKTLIEHYIVEGQPVGSRTLSKHAGLDLSPASIRNVMADLEELGYLTSPHTSAGRVPTPQGYRYFVDTLLVARPIDAESLHHIEDRLLPNNPQRVMQSASSLLSQLTQFAGVVVTSRRKPPAFRQIEFMRMSDRRVLLIVITTEGDVQNRILSVERDYSPAELVTAANFLNQHFSGQTFEAARSRLQRELHELREDMIRLMTVAIDTGDRAVSEGREQYVISGERNLLSVSELSQDATRLRQVFEMFEHKSALVRLLDTTLRSQGVQIYIGGESGVAAPDEVSVVSAAYTVDGEVVGTVGVIGPTRMAYDRVVPIVEVTAKLLSSALSPHA